MCPAAAASSTSDRDLGVSLRLGTDYEKKKKIKLREERNREYNLFLQQQAQTGRLKKRRSITLKPGQLQSSDPKVISVHKTHTHIQPPPRERPASGRDAATLTEAVDHGQRGQGHQGQRRRQIDRLKEPSSSEWEQSTDREKELKFKSRRWQDRYSPEPEQTKGRRTKEHRTERVTQDTKEVEALGLHVHNNHECSGKSDLQMPDSMRMAARSRSATGKDRAEFATGLMIGATEDQAASQMKKEKYKQELLKQIAEQQRRKRQEKTLELGVAATGATALKKEPDRNKQSGAVNRKHDSGRDVPYNPRRDLEAAGKDLNPRQKDVTPAVDIEQRAPARKFPMDKIPFRGQLTEKTVPGSETREEKGVLSRGYVDENYHRDLSNMLGDVAVPRIAGVPPPVPPTVTNYYKTPYDAAYYYYGARNPLDPNPPYNDNVVPEEVHHSISQRPSPLRPSSHAEATEQHGLPLVFIGELPADRAKQRRESRLSYQEALREQIKEREERKKREKEKEEQYNAKKAAEMMAYNPWGKSGGGAPIRDQNGNIINDLNEMHKINNESYRNPVSRNSCETQSFLMKNEDTFGIEARSPPSHQISGNNDNQPTTQQLHMQDRYKEDLKQQIKEREERKKREKEEEEQYNAKKAAEMMAYNPWGKSGGGAPIRDQNGNIINDLNEMHKINNESYRNPVSRHSFETQSFLMKNENAFGIEARSPPSHQISGNNDNQPTTQQLHMQDRYKEDLKQQIKEREERKKREKEEEEQYNAKKAAEIMAYNPWGKSGGGAPIRAQNGNIINDLNEMHKINNESYRNPVSRHSCETQGYLMKNENAFGTEARSPPSHQISGNNDNQPTTQQLHMQDRYKEDLKQQIKANKQKQEEERERMRIEEEKLEKRVAEQRARLQQEYMEERRKQKKVKTCLETPAELHEPKRKHQEEKRARQHQEIEKKVPQITRVREEKRERLNYERAESPPIPALCRKQTNLVTSRPSTVMSQLSHRTDCSVSAPHCQPVPAKKKQLHDCQQEVIRKLSVLRRCLRNMQRQLEVEMDQTDPRESHYMPPNRPRRRPRVYSFSKLARKQAVRAPTRRPRIDTACANRQNSGEFNQLKYRDVYSGDACEKHVQEQRSPQHSAEHPERTARRLHCDDGAVSTNQRIFHIKPDTQSSTGWNLESEVRPHSSNCITTHDHGGNNSRSEWPSDDEEDATSPHSALERRLSVDTAATEPWLRPGTSNAVKCPDSRETPNSRMEAPPWL